MWVLTLLLGLLVILAITAATGYFVAQEFSYMAVDRSRLKARAEQGDAAARRALQVTRRTSFMLSGAQLGITVTALLVGFVAEPLVGESLGEGLGLVGVPSAVGVGIGTTAALLLSTLVQMVFGELFPKNLSISRPEPVARRLASSTLLYLAAFGWLIRVFDAASNRLLRLLRIEPVHDVEHAATARDLEHIVADSEASGDLPAGLSQLLDRILEFPEQPVAHAMVPRARVTTVDGDETLVQLQQLMVAGHSRYPVLDADDQVSGVVHLIDVLDVLAGVRTAERAADLQRPAVLVPETMTLPAALRTLVEHRAQLACVLDEFGGFAGVLTVEDLAEELVGEIADEHDPLLPAVRPAGDGAWLVPGELPLDEVERVIGHDLPRPGVETVGGLVTALLGELPEVGTVVVCDVVDPDLHLEEDAAPQVSLEVLRLERHVPGQLRLTLLAPAPPEAPALAEKSEQSEQSEQSGESEKPMDPVVVEEVR